MLDMCRTTINVIGDCICTMVVSKTEGEFDEDIYYSDFEEEDLFEAELTA